MRRRSEQSESWEELRGRIIGLGEQSSRKSYYPELMDRLRDLEETRKSLAGVNAFLQVVMDSATEVSIIATDSSGVITLFNCGAEKLLGYRAEEMIGRNTPLSFHHADEVTAHAEEVNAAYGLSLAGFQALVERATREGSEKREWTYLCKDQRHLQVELVITAIRENGQVSGYLGIAEDISERKKAEAELYQYRENLEELVKERTSDLEKAHEALTRVVEDLNEKSEDLEIVNQRLKDIDRLKSMFIASMSHELRTPLNSIIGFTGLILQGMTGEINAEQRDQLQRVSKAGKHLLALITDVIDVSKIESGKIDAYVEEFSLDALLNDALSDLKLQIKEKGLEIEVSMIPESIFLKTDRKRLLQCVLNYLGNAVKFTEKGGITILVEEKGDTIELKVTDTGIGVKSEDLPLLFQSFVRLESPLKMTVTGTGLGLYLTRKLVTELLGGEVSVTSEYGKGSTFGLRIPKCRLKDEG